nr:RNA-directed DNA polymerase, eukaryota [Tanacetum cinerariifolium]
MASVVICLSKGQTFNFSKYIFDSLENVDEDVAHDAIPSPPPHDIPSPSQEPSSPPQQQQSSPQAPPQDAEFLTQLQQVLNVCSALSKRVENLKNDNATQKLVIVKLKTRVKKLEKANKIKSSKLRRLRKVGASRRVESSADMEDVFNQGRMIDDMDMDEGIELVNDAEEDESEVQEVVEVVTTAKLITKESLNSRKSILKAGLADLDGVIDKGDGSDADGHRRFEKPNKSRILLERDFVKRISLEQNVDLEREVSNEEIKRAVWDCDGPFILNEIVHWCKDKKKQSMIFKIDFKKAYDLVRWDFIDDILRRFGFGEKWCKWIQSYLYSSTGSVLVNGSPTKEFQFYKGLKQGDPLSPFLFILVMESLHVSFQRVVDAGLFNGVKLDSSLHISHLFYDDDAIFMGQWSQCNIDTIIRVLGVFYRASGLRINMNKSNLMGISLDSNKVKHDAAKICCLVLKMPFNYLGSRVGDLMSRIQSWHDVTEGMHTRLSKWKLKTLSIGGRLTLLKSVLGTIPIYHMSIFKIPIKVLQNMESIRVRFFNGADVNSKKPSWVRWKSVLAAKDVGGLGVSSLF